MAAMAGLLPPSQTLILNTANVQRSCAPAPLTCHRGWRWHLLYPVSPALITAKLVSAKPSPSLKPRSRAGGMLPCPQVSLRHMKQPLPSQCMAIPILGKQPGTFTTPHPIDSLPNQILEVGEGRFCLNPLKCHMSSNPVHRAPQKGYCHAPAAPATLPLAENWSFMDALTYSPLSNSCPCGFSYFRAATPKQHLWETPCAEKPSASIKEHRKIGQITRVNGDAQAECDTALSLLIWASKIWNKV